MLHPGSYLPGGAGFYSVRPQAQGKAGVAAGRLKWMADHQALQFVGDLNYDGSDAEPIDIGVANEFVELQRGRIDLHNVRCLRRAQSLPASGKQRIVRGPVFTTSRSIPWVVRFADWPKSGNQASFGGIPALVRSPCHPVDLWDGSAGRCG